MDLAQVNFRIPEDARPLVLRIGARLREDPAFLGDLDRWFGGLEADAALSQNPMLAGRLAEIERRLAVLEARPDTTAAPVPVETVAAVPVSADQAEALARNELRLARNRLNATALRRGFSFSSRKDGGVILKCKGGDEVAFEGTTPEAASFLAAFPVLKGK